MSCMPEGVWYLIFAISLIYWCLNCAEISQREHSQENLSDNILFGQVSPLAGIGRMRAIVAHYEIFIFSERFFHRSRCLPHFQIRFFRIHSFAFFTYKNLAISYLDRFSGQTDDAFDILLRWLVRIFEYDDVSTLWLVKTIAYLIHNKIV